MDYLQRLKRKLSIPSLLDYCPTFTFSNNYHQSLSAFSASLQSSLQNCYNSCRHVLSFQTSITSTVTQHYDQWEIDRRSLTLIRKIGAGLLSEVWEAKCNHFSTSVAVKKLIPGIPAGVNNEFLAEAQIMKRLTHPKLLQLFAACTKEVPFLIITELMQEDLLRFLKGTGRKCNINQLVDISAQIASGMIYLGDNNIVHRDLAARNILISSPFIVKIADFGSSRLIQENKVKVRGRTNKFSIRWTAPEASFTFIKITVKSDVWSFGILLTELFTFGRIPYSNMKNGEILFKVKKGYRMSIPPKCPIIFYQIMLECWHQDPKKRPSFETLHWKLKNQNIKKLL